MVCKIVLDSGPLLLFRRGYFTDFSIDHVANLLSIAGTIPFVGLMVPHLARAWVGVDYRRVVPLCAVLGAALLLYADLLARFLAVSGGSPIPVGLVTTVLGTPFLLVIVRRMRLVD